MSDNNFKIIPLDELKKTVNNLRRPIDFDKLLANGLLKKAGSWFEVPNIDDLPNHVVQKISKSRVEQDMSKPIVDKTFVKFFKH